MKPGDTVYIFNENGHEYRADQAVLSVTVAEVGEFYVFSRDRHSKYATDKEEVGRTPEEGKVIAIRLLRREANVLHDLANRLEAGR